MASDPFLQCLSITRLCKGSQCPYQIRASPVPWGPPWLCFSEMRWIGQLKRLSSGWPAAIKGSPSGYSDATESWLYLCLILQFIVIFFSRHSLAPKSVEYLYSYLFLSQHYITICIWTKVVYSLLNCTLYFPSALSSVVSILWKDANIRRAEVKWVRLKQRLGVGTIVLL